jgi:hypothetical protein
MNSFANIPASDLRRAADIKDQIETLQDQLNGILGDPLGNGRLRPARPSPIHRPRRGNAKSGKTVAECVLESIGAGETVPIRKLIIRASQIRGKAISRALMGFTLAQMKKAKQLVNPLRGHYRRA